MVVTFSSTVCGGFPVDVEATVERYDRHDYGHYGTYSSNGRCLTDIDLFKRGKRQSVGFIEKKMTSDDWEKLFEEAVQACER